MMTALQEVRSADELRREVASARGRGLTVGFVPTMGALHEGHAALIARSAAENDLTVVSIFVNPTQFDDPGDLEAYPRSEDRDVELAAAAGAEICFLPAVEEIYPPGSFTQVTMRGPLTETFEGARRGAGHFDGVCTVLTILFAIVDADTAYFGAKDAQQLQVVRKLARDLRLPLAIEAVETVRDTDGLALSSRNSRIPVGERGAALSLSRALAAVGRAVTDGTVTDSAEAEALGLELLAQGGSEPEYFAAVDPQSFEPDPEPCPSTLLLCAARVGDVRLIDNMTVQFAAATGLGVDHDREEK